MTMMIISQSQQRHRRRRRNNNNRGIFFHHVLFMIVILFNISVNHLVVSQQQQQLSTTTTTTNNYRLVEERKMPNCRERTKITVWDETTYLKMRQRYREIVGLEQYSTDFKQSGFQVPIEVQASIGRGRGLFATQFIPKNTIVWKPIHQAKFVTETQTKQFMFDFNDDQICDLLFYFYILKDPTTEEVSLIMELDEMNLRNSPKHDSELNIRQDFFGTGNIIATRDIQAGEELIQSYGVMRASRSVKWFYKLKTDGWGEDFRSYFKKQEPGKLEEKDTTTTTTTMKAAVKKAVMSTTTKQQQQQEEEEVAPPGKQQVYLDDAGVGTNMIRGGSTTTSSNIIVSGKDEFDHDNINTITKITMRDIIMMMSGCILMWVVGIVKKKTTASKRHSH